MYVRFAASLVASTLAMYALSFSEIELAEHFHLSLSNFYITLMMVSAMGLIMLTAMSSMLDSKRLNIGLYAGFAALLVTAFVLGRNQVFVGDKAFLRSMIPHHSRAILVCQESRITDQQIRNLCDGIIKTQRKEISEMEAFLAKLGAG